MERNPSDTAQDDNDLRICFSYSRKEWLKSQSPALPFWFAFAAPLLFLIIVLARESLWFLLLLLPWWIVGRHVVGIVLLLIRGRQEVVLVLHDRGCIGVSGDAGNTVTPILSPRIEDEEQSWLLYGDGGPVRVVIPKSQLSPENTKLLMNRIGQPVENER